MASYSIFLVLLEKLTFAFIIHISSEKKSLLDDYNNELTLQSNLI